MSGLEGMSWEQINRKRTKEGKAIALELLHAATGKPVAYLDTRSDAVLRCMRMELAAPGAPERLAGRIMALTRGVGCVGETPEAEEELLRAVLHFMADWLPSEDWNIEVLVSITCMAQVRGDRFISGLDVLIGQISTGYIELSGEVRDASGRVLREAERKPSDLVRADGAIPAEMGGMSEDDDEALRLYRSFKRRFGSPDDERQVVYGAKLRLLNLSAWANEPVFNEGEYVDAMRMLVGRRRTACF